MANEIVKSSSTEILLSQDDIQRKIYTIRGVQVMLDRDLAQLYQVPTGRLNEAVKRNKDSFPEDFMFQLTDEETANWKSQIAITNSIKMGLRHNPYAFTEEGVSQLSHVLKSKMAVQVGIRITRAFVAMRKFIMSNAGIFQRLETVELKQIATDKKIDQILDRLDDGSLKAKLGIFFDGQMFDAFVLIEELIQKATRRIVLIDDYINASVLQRFHERNPGVTLDCYVKTRFATDDLKDAFTNYNTQYPSEATTLHTFECSHDRWLIIDDTVYHFGASIKDLGKKWFSVDVITEISADDLISRL